VGEVFCIDLKEMISEIASMKLIKRLRAFTLIELLVVISIIAILAALALPAITGALARGQMSQTVSNFRQLHFVATQIALDGSSSGDTNLAWPGDLPTKTWAYWAGIVTNGYLTPAEFAKVCSAQSVIAVSNTISVSSVPGTSRAVVGYQVSDTNDSSVVIFSSSNFTNSASPQPPLAESKPYGSKGFIVFRKGGDGAILQNSQATNTNLIGGFAATLN